MEASSIRHSGRLGTLLGPSPLLKLQGDERLLAMIRAGRESAFEVLFDRYRTRLFQFCRHMLRSKEDAEDVLQEVFVAAYNAMRADEREIHVRPWLYRIARNRCLNFLRRPVPTGQDSMDIHVHAHGTTTADRVEQRDAFRSLLSDVGNLPESQRTALLLREIESLSYDEISIAMDTTVPSVKSLLVRARVALAESAQAREISCGDVRTEMAMAAEGLGKPDALVRRHIKQCASCRKFKTALKRTDRTLAALLPIGLIASFKKFALVKLLTGGTGGAAAGSGGAAGTVGGAIAGSAGTTAASTAAVTGAAIAGSTAGGGGIVSAGLGAIAGKAVAGVAAMTLVATSAVEVQHRMTDPIRTPNAAAASHTRSAPEKHRAEAVALPPVSAQPAVTESLAPALAQPPAEIAGPPAPAEASVIAPSTPSEAEKSAETVPTTKEKDTASLPSEAEVGSKISRPGNVPTGQPTPTDGTVVSVVPVESAPGTPPANPSDPPTSGTEAGPGPVVAEPDPPSPEPAPVVAEPSDEPTDTEPVDPSSSDQEALATTPEPVDESEDSP